ncbi:AmpG family muropeptide MFS transporter [Acidithiobacillus thiooxidans]|uniref:Permease n=1 Tax=Acidithiobacillus thiooxidans TaxID=930 RepID=A0A1C2IMC4_ACITH|nr:MFS transporter [Acidithiobacillus thiooxidans]MBE7566430.1 MFS transporter [Acidithiobacillus sp. HP-11]MBU2741203.1 AmpG family muropeptide MFS transporter [Acidithiobacillus albertensis]MBU2751709.1 AmpG family muropeptide MFS transporter [Acidithiobacillus thiooxidans]MBU2792012.1 AmpG family muropeptide MFS transporter [Acidithiobacillus thiooxidans]MBU2837950.1 AmpG family muropeptide MFS transporter [Acidithiobacillus thiooxidans]
MENAVAIKFKKLSWIASTYYAEGLPYSLVQQVSVQFFTYAGASLQVIGLLSFFGLPWNLKLFWSPVIDLFGNKKRWLVVMELILGAVAALLIWPAQHLNLDLAAKIFILMAFMSATHDMSVDGYYIQTLDTADQAGFSGLRVAAYRVAMLVGNGALVILAGWISWTVCFLTAAFMMWGLAAFHKWILPEPPPANTQHQGHRWAAVREAFQTYLAQPGIVWALAFILLFRAGDAMMFAMVTPFLNHLGYGLIARGILTGSVGTVTGIGGALLGGLIISRWGLKRALFPLTLIQSLAIPAYAWLAWADPSIWWVGVTIAFEQGSAGLGTAVLMVFLMQRCQENYQATHFAIGSALMSVAATVVGGFSGFLAAKVGFVEFFLLAFVAAIPSLLLAIGMPDKLYQDKKSPI